MFLIKLSKEDLKNVVNTNEEVFINDIVNNQSKCEHIWEKCRGCPKCGAFEKIE